MFLSNTYEALMQRILEKHPAGEGKKYLTTDIKHVDLYYGQDIDELGQLNVKGDVPLPAVFIEFQPMQMATISGRKHQQSETTSVIFYLISATKLDTKSTVKANHRQLALEHLERLEQLHYRLQGFAGDFFTSLDRVGIDPYGSNGVVIKHALTYRCRFKDDSALQNYKTLTAPSLTASLIIEPEA